MPDTIKRCPWCGDDPLYPRYHDEEWGLPSFDERYLFECLVLEGAQAGLSWITILRKRDNYRAAFDNFDAEKMARYGERKVRTLLGDAGIVRHELKIRAAIENAKAVLALRDAGGSLAELVWGFVDGRPQQNRWRSLKQVPAKTETSTKLSAELKRLGFKFVGPTTCYAFMQAVGMVNDHLASCHRHRACAGVWPPSTG